MSRIAARFQKLAEQGKTALITYIVAGDPDLASTVPLLHGLVASGADILELGVPFSDPMAEGPVIQLGHERSLASGTTMVRVLEMVAAFREQDGDTPILLMGYVNPIEHMGYREFAAAAAKAGVDGLITVDLPPEEVETMNAALQAEGMDNIFLVAPTTPPQRIAHIAQRASGFIYYVSLKGVTGAGNLDTSAVATRVAEIRQNSALPVAVGFGIKDGESARAVAAVADGVVVGSALISRIAGATEAGNDPLSAAADLMAEIRAGIDSAAS